jgi:hypothetical protein
MNGWAIFIMSLRDSNIIYILTPADESLGYFDEHLTVLGIEYFRLTA